MYYWNDLTDPYKWLIPLTIGFGSGLSSYVAFDMGVRDDKISTGVGNFDWPYLPQYLSKLSDLKYKML